MQQLITPNPYIPCKPGWCLAYVNQAFRVPIRFPSATAAWKGSATKHRDYDFPDAWVPLWFALATEPNGHVALRAPDGRVFSTTDPYALWPTEHPNLAHLINAYARYNPLTFLGWTEDVEGTAVVAPGSIRTQSATITATTGTVPALIEQDDEMLVIARDTSSADPDKTWIGNGVTRRHIPDPKTLAQIQDMARSGALNVFKDGEVQLFPEKAMGELANAEALAKIAELEALVAQLSVKQGVTIDYAKIAKAVNDDAASRMVK